MLPNEVHPETTEGPRGARLGPTENTGRPPIGEFQLLIRRPVSGSNPPISAENVQRNNDALEAIKMERAHAWGEAAREELESGALKIAKESSEVKKLTKVIGRLEGELRKPGVGDLTVFRGDIDWLAQYAADSLRGEGSSLQASILNLKPSGLQRSVQVSPEALADLLEHIGGLINEIETLKLETASQQGELSALRERVGKLENKLEADIKRYLRSGSTGIGKDIASVAAGSGSQMSHLGMAADGKVTMWISQLLLLAITSHRP
jgi:hypothetical protein